MEGFFMQDKKALPKNIDIQFKISFYIRRLLLWHCLKANDKRQQSCVGIFSDWPSPPPPRLLVYDRVEKPNDPVLCFQIIAVAVKGDRKENWHF